MIKVWLKAIFSMLLMALPMAFSSCDPNTVEEQSLPNYVPLRVGNYQIYQVNETQITAFNIETDFTYELKTVVTDSIVNAQGGYSYIMSRSKRNTDSDPWQPMDTWLIRANENEVVITEGTIPFVRLTFPIKNDRTWNGNAYNNIETGKFCGLVECDQYTLADVQREYTTSTQAFTNTITIIQSNDPDLLTRYDVRKEIYAAGVGLIFKESVVYNYCTQAACFGQQLIESGFRLTQELKAYGRE